MFKVEKGQGRAVWFTNQLVTLRIEGKQTAGAYEVYDAIDQPGGGPGEPHVHPAQETFYVLEGTIEFHVMRNGAMERHRMGPGGVLHVAANEPHGYVNVGTTPSLMTAVASPAGVMEPMFLEFGVPVKDPNDIPPPPTSGLIAELGPKLAKYGCYSYTEWKKRGGE